MTKRAKKVKPAPSTVRRSLEEMEARDNAAIKRAGVPDEKAMRALAAPFPKTLDELAAFIKTLVDRPHTYGTCVYAMSLAAVAAFNHVSHVLGVTGFQASCADMDILRRTRSLERFMIVNGENVLYPQYDLMGQVKEWLGECAVDLKKHAAEKLLTDGATAHPAVRYRWQQVAAGEYRP